MQRQPLLYRCKHRHPILIPSIRHRLTPTKLLGVSLACTLHSNFPKLNFCWPTHAYSSNVCNRAEIQRNLTPTDLSSYHPLDKALPNPLRTLNGQIIASFFTLVVDVRKINLTLNSITPNKPNKCTTDGVCVDADFVPAVGDKRGRVPAVCLQQSP